MISCKHCNTLNSLDSTFCKRCGTGLPEDEIQTGKEKLQALVDEGVTALSQGRLEESMAIAETAVSADPSMASALSLKASVHERRGEIAEALDCAERIVDLNPDSELDKIKRNQLRASLAANALANRPPSRAVAVIAALSAAMIVGCGVVLATRLIARPAPDARVALNTSVQTPQSLTTAQTTPENQSAATGQNSPSTAPLQMPPTYDFGKNVVTGGAGPADLTNPSSPGGETPRSGRSGSGAALPSTSGQDLNVEPVSPPGPPANVANSAPPKAADNAGSKPADPAPTPDVVKPSAPREDPGQIEIRIHQNSVPTSRGSAEGGVRDTSKMYLHMGNDYYQMGNYKGAASSYANAVSSGADPVTANQRLAQSYSSLGKRSEAAEAYKKAIQAASSSLNSGKGNFLQS